MPEWAQVLQVLSLFGGFGGMFLLQFNVSRKLGKIEEQVSRLPTKAECDARHMQELTDCDGRHEKLAERLEADRIALARLQTAAAGHPRTGSGSQP